MTDDSADCRCAANTAFQKTASAMPPMLGPFPWHSRRGTSAERKMVTVWMRRCSERGRQLRRPLRLFYAFDLRCPNDIFGGKLAKCCLCFRIDYGAGEPFALVGLTSQVDGSFGHGATSAEATLGQRPKSSLSKTAHLYSGGLSSLLSQPAILFDFIGSFVSAL